MRKTALRDQYEQFVCKDEIDEQDFHAFMQN